MSMTINEYEMEEGLSRLYEENIEEFTSDRLISFYQSDWKLLIPAFNALDTAKKIKFNVSNCISSFCYHSN